MGNYAKAKGRSNPTFAMLRHDIMDSPAYRSLDPATRCVYNEILRRFNNFNNGKIPLSCREAAERTNISKDTTSRAFKKLMDAGFIKENADNYFYVLNKKSRRWILTQYPYNGRSPTNEWRKFKPQSDDRDKHVSPQGQEKKKQ